MPDRYASRVIDHLQHDTYKPATVDRLMDDLGVDPAERGIFGQSIAAMVREGRLLLDERGLVVLPPMGDEVVGVFRKNARGFGFVVPTSPVREGDVFIPPDGIGKALSGDTVRVEVQRRRSMGEDRISGVIVDVLTRKRARFTGELLQRERQWLVFPDGRELTEPVVVRDPQAKNAKAGDKVVVEITVYPEGSMLAEGVITDVLGEAGLPSVETQAVIAAYGLPGDFDEAVYAEARAAADVFADEVKRAEVEGWRGRDDLRPEFILTIDPPDAKDYDDALHIRRTEDGWELGVHIADVAHFIRPGGPLDEEARKRGNSVYLPRHVIPMLPENLSNGICSLQEGVVRYCKSAFMHYDRRGNLLRSGVAQVAIKSAKRLTYLEAQALIDGDPEEAKKHAKTEPNYTPQLLDALREMDACSKMIRERRRAAGMIHLDLPDVELIYDADGRVVDAQREDDAYTHTLIEMFMVEANEVLARLFERVRVPLLRRVHPEPTPGDVEDLRQVSRVAGFVIPKRPTRQELQKLLDATRGTAAAAAVHFAVLRTLTRAEYSPALIGHFALASEAYAHFTSPIRRYPDLTVHRALAEYLRLTDNGKRPPKDDQERAALGARLRESPMCPDEPTLVKIGMNCSRTEENATAAERSLREFLVLQLLSNHVGESFPAMVTGVTGAGIFVKLEKFLAEGMIKSADLPVGKEGRSGAWRIDQRTGALVNQASGRVFKIGDRVTVTIAKIDLALRRMELVVTDAASRDKGKGAKIAKLDPNSLAGGMAGGGAKLDWEQIKNGQSGSARRSQKSKARDKGKKQHRREK